MREQMAMAWRWIAVGGLLAALGLLVFFGLGKRRGSKAYRWRIALWGLILALSGATAMVSSCAKTGSGNGDDIGPSCYKPSDEIVRGDTDAQALDTCYAELGTPEGTGFTCYLPELQPPPDTGVTCYKEVSLTEEVGPTCYADVQLTEEVGTTCYLPEDIGPREEEPSATCYLEFTEQVGEEAQAEVFATCYKMAPPDTIEE